MAYKTPPIMTNAGIPPTSDENLLAAESNGPIPLQDHYLIQKMAEFNCERIPERVLRAAVVALALAALMVERRGTIPMTLRHTAALALVGWYLMVPPFQHSWTGDVQYWMEQVPGVLPTGRTPVPMIDKCTPEAPLSEWTQFDEYETLSECKSGQEKVQDRTREQIESAEKALEGESKDAGPSKAEKLRNEEEVDCALYAKCVATDDPRLKRD